MKARELLVSENVLEKAAVFAVGCCSLGAVTTAAGVAGLLAPGAALVGVLGAITLKAVLKEEPARLKAFRTVKQQMGRKFVTAYEASEPDVKAAQESLAALVGADNLFSVESLRDAVAIESDVVPGLTRLSLAAVAKRDNRFAVPGMARDFAEQLFGDAFQLAIEQCPDFRQQAILTVTQTTLGELRQAGKKIDAIASKLETIDVLSDDAVHRIANAIHAASERRRAQSERSFFFVEFEGGSKSLGVAVDNRGLVICASYARKPTKVVPVTGDAALDFDVVQSAEGLTALRLHSRTDGVIGDYRAADFLFGEVFKAFDRTGTPQEVECDVIEMTCQIQGEEGPMWFDHLVMFKRSIGGDATEKLIAGPILDEFGSVVAFSIAGSRAPDGTEFAVCVPWHMIVTPPVLALNWGRIDRNSGNTDLTS